LPEHNMKRGEIIYKENTRRRTLFFCIVFLILALLALFLSFSFFKGASEGFSTWLKDDFSHFIASIIIFIISVYGVFYWLPYTDLIITEKGVVLPQRTVLQLLKNERVFIRFVDMKSIEFMKSRTGHKSGRRFKITTENNSYLLMWDSLSRPKKVYYLIKKGIEKGKLDPGVLREIDIGMRRSRRKLLQGKKRRR